MSYPRIPARKLGPARLLARPQHHISGRIAPSGRFTLGSLPKSPPKCKSYRRNQDEEENVPDLPGEDNAEVGDAYGQLSLLCPVPEVDTGMGIEEQEPLGSLGSSSSAISHKRGKPGCRGISGKSADQLKYWLTQFEARWGRDRLSFATLTLPSLEESDREVVQMNWSEIVRRFVQEIKRELARKGGINTDVLGCTEIQPKRSARERWDVPHLHLVFLGRIGFTSRWLLRPKEIRRLWARIICSYISGTGIDFGACENVQRVRVSVARYLAKYLSKSISKSATATSSTKWHPSSYVILPGRFRSWFRGSTAKGFEVALYILEVMKIADSVNGFWMAPITIETSIGEQVMGWVGYNPEWIRMPPDSIWSEYE